MSEPEFILDVLRAFADHDEHGSLWWRFDDDEIRFFANCGDVFAWGGSDCEQITPENLPLLRQAFADAKQAGPRGEYYGLELFVSRIRRTRPQGAAYPKDLPELWPLFDACGPKRHVGIGNPSCHPGDKKHE